MSAPPSGQERRQQRPPPCFAPTPANHRRRHRRQQRPSSSAGRAFAAIAVSPAAPPAHLLSVPPLSLGGEGFDGIELEEGPDPDDILLQGEPEMLARQEEEEEYEAELAAAEAAEAASAKVESVSFFFAL